ncbi:MAG: hypothetical protein IPK48_00140 [Gammaproteobacteria bacterium]|nr:hypothetical protein [Gammaproteobacteria bacterium]
MPSSSHLQAEQIVGGHAVFQAVHAAGVFGHVAPMVQAIWLDGSGA